MTEWIGVFGATIALAMLILVTRWVGKILTLFCEIRTDLARHEKFSEGAITSIKSSSHEIVVHLNHLLSEHKEVMESGNNQNMEATVAIIERLDTMINTIPNASVAAAMAHVPDAPMPRLHQIDDGERKHPNRLFTRRPKWTPSKKKSV